MLSLAHRYSSCKLSGTQPAHNYSICIKSTCSVLTCEGSRLRSTHCDFIASRRQTRSRGEYVVWRVDLLKTTQARDDEQSLDTHAPEDQYVSHLQCRYVCVSMYSMTPPIVPVPSVGYTRTDCMPHYRIPTCAHGSEPSTASSTFTPLFPALLPLPSAIITPS
jgi:hypothetical protein